MIKYDTVGIIEIYLWHATFDILCILYGANRKVEHCDLAQCRQKGPHVPPNWPELSVADMGVEGTFVLML